MKLLIPSFSLIAVSITMLLISVCFVGAARHQHHHQSGSTSTAPFRKHVAETKVSNLSMFGADNASITPIARPTAGPRGSGKKSNRKYKKGKKSGPKYHNKTNLKLVYKSVLPPGMKRPEDNVVFEYTDNEEGKTCRCICRMK